MMCVKPLEEQIREGTAKAEGDISILTKLAAAMADFNPRFEIMPGTEARAVTVAEAGPYQAVPERIVPE